MLDTALAVVYVSLLLSLCTVADAARESYYRYDGKGNNEQNPTWGAVGEPLLRHQAPVEYGDGQSSLSGPNISARVVSMKLMGDGYPSGKRSDPSSHTAMLTYIGQLFDHDLDFSPLSAEVAPIPIPCGDAFFDPAISPNHSCQVNKTMPFMRSAYVMDAVGIRQQFNNVTSYLDGSVIYGADEVKARTLRTLSKGEMKVDNGMTLPRNVDLIDMSNLANIVPPKLLRAAGDRRQNVNPQMLALSSVWLREHNRRARDLAYNHPDWTDEQLYTRARQLTTAILQAVCYYEYLPNLGLILDEYKGYNASTNPSTDAFFSTVSYRYGHSKVHDVIYRLDNQGREIDQGHLLLRDAYFNPSVALSAGVEPLLRGMAIQFEGLVEPRFSTSIQNHLFGMAGFNGTDLIARDIQRGRDHGIPGYNKCRTSMGLKRAESWVDVTPDAKLRSVLEDIYGPSPDLCDPIVCGLAEPKVKGSHFGDLFYTSMADQYLRTRDGDWFYFENKENGLFTEDELKQIKGTGFREVIVRNYDTQLPANIWRADPNDPWLSCSGPQGAAPDSQIGVLGSNRSAASSASFQNGKYVLGWKVERVGEEDFARFTVEVQGTGWVGLGIAPGPSSKMVGADIMVVSVPAPPGTAQVDDYFARGFNKPTLDVTQGGTSDVQLISASEENGVTTAEFRRPLKATNPGIDLPISTSTPVTVIFAWHPSSDDITYHMSNAGVAQLQISQGSDSVTVVSSGGRSSDYLVGKVHGILMAIAFAFVFPLGALFGRMINMCALGGQGALRKVIFQCHMGCQLGGTCIAFVGFVYGFAAFSSQVKLADIPHGHGSLGIVVFIIMILQVKLGLMRPHDTPPQEPQRPGRRIWEFSHHLLGRSVIFLGIVNVGTGIYIISTDYAVSPTQWIALVATSFVVLATVDACIDRHERQHIRAAQVQIPGLPKGIPTRDTRMDVQHNPLSGMSSLGSSKERSLFASRERD